MIEPYSEGFGDLVRRLAPVIKTDMNDVEILDEGVHAGGTWFYIVRNTAYAGAGASPHVSVTIEDRMWPTVGEASEQVHELKAAVATGDATVTWFQLDEQRVHGQIGPSGDSLRGTVRFDAFSDPPRSTLTLTPWFQGPAPEDTSDPGPLQQYIDCAHPGGHSVHTTPSVKYETWVEEHQVRVPQDGHHCGGPAWWVSVDMETGAVLDEREHLCY